MTANKSGAIERPSGASSIARLEADEQTAKRIAAALSEVLDPDSTAVALFESVHGWTIEIHFTGAPNRHAVRALLADVAGAAAAASLAFASLAHKDWVAASLAGLAPVRAGRFFLHGAHHRKQLPANCIAVEIEAALAFGTGHHGTTRGCLLALDRLLKVRKVRRVLDLGTGTGVLAIAAAKSLRRPVLASDIDRTAVRAALANARKNGVGTLVQVVKASQPASPRFRRGRYDLIFANILLGPLQRLAAPIARRLAPHANVVLSGLLPRQANAAISSYAAHGLRLKRRIALDSWTTLVLARVSARTAAGPRSAA